MLIITISIIIILWIIFLENKKVSDKVSLFSFGFQMIPKKSLKNCA
jgi:hypothetical protein